MTLTKNTLLLTSASIFAAGLGFLFNPFLIARPLGPDGIAILGTFLSVYQCLLFPQRPLSLLLTQSIAHAGANGEPGNVGQLLRQIQKKILGWGLPLLIVLIIVSPSIAQFLNLQSTAPIIYAGFFAMAGISLTAFDVCFQAQLRFRWAALILCLPPFFRVLIGLVILVTGIHIQAVLLCFVLSFVFTLIIACRAQPDVFRQSTSSALVAENKMPISSGWIYSVFLAVTLSIDVLLVKHYFAETDAGFYIAAATLAKMMFIIFTPISSVSYSMMCHDVANQKNPLYHHLRSLGLLLASCLTMVGGCVLFSSLIIRLVYGNAFMPAAAYLPQIAVALLPLVILMQWGQFQFAKKNTLFIYGFGLGTIVQLFLMLCYHQSIAEIILMYGIGGSCQLIFSLPFGLGTKKRVLPDVP